MEQHWSLEGKRAKYKSRIREERANFFFLKGGSMVIPSEKFDSYWDALVDSIVNHGEDIDDMVSLVFPEKVDHAPVRRKLIDCIGEIRQ